MKASDVMTKPVITVRPATTIDDAARLLTEGSVNTLPVTDGDGRLVGAVTETEVFHALALRLGIGLSPTARLDDQSTPRRVSDISKPVSAAVHAGDEMSYCLAVMARNGGRSLPVLDAGQVVGIISRREALRALAQVDLAALQQLVGEGRLAAVPEMVGQ